MPRASRFGPDGIAARSDPPFTETERIFLESIRDWGKKIVLVVNKVDISQVERDLAEVVQFVRESSMRLLSIVPQVFPVSARLAAGALSRATRVSGLLAALRSLGGTFSTRWTM
jgi:GTPase Era involved in 16S rRNA processing